MTPRKIGFLYPGYQDADFDSWRIGFAKALEERSWIEGGNLLIEWRFAEYNRERYDELANELASAEVAALATAGTPLTHILSRATSSIPIVTGVGDPVGSGFAISLERPGRNITGLSWALREKARAQVGLLLEMAPAVATLMVLRSQRYGDIPELNACLEGVASEHGLRFAARAAESFDEIEAALDELAGRTTSAVVIYTQGAFQFDDSALAKAAIERGVVAFGDERRAVEAGCLMSYGVRHQYQERSFASALDRILRGESPAVIPFELPTKAEFILNRSTAAALGLTLPAELLRRANAVIE